MMKRDAPPNLKAERAKRLRQTTPTKRGPPPQPMKTSKRARGETPLGAISPRQLARLTAAYVRTWMAVTAHDIRTPKSPLAALDALDGIAE